MRTWGAATVDPEAAMQALRTVIVVRDTMKQLEEQLESGDYPPDIRGLVKSIIKNYKLRENLAKAMALVAKERQAEANQFGQSATEYLYSIIEVRVIHETATLQLEVSTHSWSSA